MFQIACLDAQGVFMVRQIGVSHIHFESRPHHLRIVSLKSVYTFPSCPFLLGKHDIIHFLFRRHILTVCHVIVFRDSHLATFLQVAIESHQGVEACQIGITPDDLFHGIGLDSLFEHPKSGDERSPAVARLVIIVIEKGITL